MTEVLPLQKKKWGYVKGHCNILLVLQLCCGGVGLVPLGEGHCDIFTSCHYGGGVGGGRGAKGETRNFTF